MPFEIVTTHFVAHERDLEEAYALYRERIETSGAVISAVSPLSLIHISEPTRRS